MPLIDRFICDFMLINICDLMSYLLLKPSLLSLSLDINCDFKSVFTVKLIVKLSMQISFPRFCVKLIMTIYCHLHLFIVGDKMSKFTNTSGCCYNCLTFTTAIIVAY